MSGKTENSDTSAENGEDALSITGAIEEAIGEAVEEAFGKAIDDAPGDLDSDNYLATQIIVVSSLRERYLAVSGIVLSAALMAAASGTAFAYIPLKLHAGGYAPWVAAAMTPSLALGGLGGCFATGWLLRLSGHARVYMILYALIVISMIIIAFFTSPIAWLIARMGYGFAINGVFIVAQSWLHHASTDEIRGKVITLFYVAYVVSLGLGSFSVGYLPLEDNSIPILATLFVALAMLPVGLTRLPQPEPPERISIDIRRVWEISPVGLAGMFAVGGATMLLQSFSPIYMSEQGYAKADIGLMLLLMQIGLIAIQIPLGAMSDKMDRRYILVFVAGGALIASSAAFLGHGASGLWALIILFALWNGFNETIYSVSSALANDRADPKDYVMLSSTQMIAWSMAAFVVPLIGTIMLAFMPIQFFMLTSAFIAAGFLVFVLRRIQTTKAVRIKDMEDFQPVTAQVAYPGDFANPDAYEETEAETAR